MHKKVTKIAQKSHDTQSSFIPKGLRSNYGQSINSPSDHILYLQRSIGNQSVQRLYKSGFFQTKLTIGQPNDKYEQEADRVAEQIMRTSDSDIQRKPN